MIAVCIKLLFKPVRTTVLKEIPDDPVFRKEWNDLVGRMERPEVFFTHQWALAASRAFRAAFPLLFLMHEGEELRGIAALATARDYPDTAFFLTASTADYCDILSAPQDCSSVLAALLQELARMNIHELTLANLPADSKARSELPAVASKQGFRLAARAAYECGIVEFGDEHQRQTILETVRRKSREQRGLKKLSKLGSVELKHIVNPRDAANCLPDIISAQVSRFLASGRLSPLLQNERRTFLQQLTVLLASENYLKITQLELSGQPIAWNYGFRFGAGWFWYLPSFRFEYENCSPGSCLLRLLVEEACAAISVLGMSRTKNGLPTRSARLFILSCRAASCDMER